jgi:hydroxymethylglutaryl-CoA lyase
MRLPAAVVIREVGPRDGLQAEAPIPVEARVRLIQSLVVAGVSSMEICSFVSPKAVPAMADGAAVVAGVGVVPGVLRAALVPNLRGAQAALEAGVDELTGTVSVSEVYSAKNVRMSVAESVAGMGDVCALATAASVPVDVVLSFCFG